MLAQCTTSLVEAHDLVMFDLDGVIYVGADAVPGAADVVTGVRAGGGHVAFVTNNASRTPAQVARRLTRLGVAAEPEDVVTSAQAAARVIVDEIGAGVRVLALGSTGLREALSARGLVVVGPPDDPAGEWPDVEAVVSGYGPEVRWRDVMVAATMVRDGVPYVASNTDGTIPTARGPQPGHGVLVETIARFAGIQPRVAGKPSPPLLEETIRRVGGSRPLMVGDRLDTDIAGGAAVGVPTLLVMTGVTDAATLVAAAGDLRPSYVAADLDGLLTPHPQPEVDGRGSRVGGWHACVDRDGQMRVDGRGDRHDWWRAVAAAGWQHLDRTGGAADVSRLNAPVDEDAAARE